jgi:Ca-activated chloride channel family protein
MMHSRSWTSRVKWALAAVPPALALSALLILYPRPVPAQEGGPIDLLFLYGSEKKAWINEVNDAFKKSNPTVDGRPIHVKAVAKGSGDTVDELLEGGTQAHLISPASGAYLELGNARALKKGEKPLVGDKRNNLVLSPVVIAMWEPMARKALGWPDKEIGWQDLRDLARNGWGSRGYPSWDPFKFGHTHPESSNSGLITLLSEAYAANAPKKRLTVADVQSQATADFLQALESSVVHYGESTGFFADRMFDRGGRNTFGAAVMYENLVIESYTNEKYRIKLAGADKVVAIYPKEGTFWSDHPVAVVERDWVTPQHRKAAEQYIAFLLQDEQQRKALKHGFRPGVDSVEIGTPIDRAHGADPNKPGGNVLRPPEADVMEACLKTWQKYKKKARIVLVIDCSYKMNFNSKLFMVRDGAGDIIDSLNPGDWIAVLAFGDDVRVLEQGLEVSDKPDRAKADKEALKAKLETLEAKGKRKLFDAVWEAHQHLQGHKKAGTIPGVVVLANNEPDTGSSLSLDALLKKIEVGDDLRNDIRVCIFAYATAKSTDDLKKIAEATRGPKPMEVAGEAKPETVRKVLRALATFF